MNNKQNSKPRSSKIAALVIIFVTYFSIGSLIGITACVGEKAGSAVRNAEQQSKQPSTNHDKWSSVISDDGKSLCALDLNNDLYCWGNNTAKDLGTTYVTYRQDILGTGSNDKMVSAPRKVLHTFPWKQVKMREGKICGRDQEGHLFCWGINTHGLASSALPHFQPKINGKENEVVTKPYLIDNSQWIDLTMQESSICGIKSDGSLWCFGERQGSPIPQQKRTGNFTSVSIVGRRIITSNAQGQVFDGKDPLSSLSFKVMRGSYFNNDFLSYLCGIDVNDKAYCQGANKDSVLGVASTETDLPDFVEIKHGGNFSDLVTSDGRTCAIKLDKTLWCWGKNSVNYGSNQKFGILGTGNRAEFVTEPERVLELGNVKQVTMNAAGSICAIDSLEHLYCWGKNYISPIKRPDITDIIGVLGTNNITDKVLEKPTHVDSQQLWKKVYMFSSTFNSLVNCAINTADALFCWGYSYVHVGPSESIETLALTPTLVKTKVTHP